MRILLTGGGTGGHIFPNIAIVEEAYKKLRKASSFQLSAFRKDSNDKSRIWTEKSILFLYIGEKEGMEKEIVRKAGIEFRGIYCGKLRRYFSLRTVFDIVKIPIGFIQALLILKKFKPQVIFSKGGYVSIPVVIAGWVLGIKIITHDSDSIPGLSTRIIANFADMICLAYKECSVFFQKKKVVITGIPLRKNNTHGIKANGYRLTGFSSTLPIVLVLGGSLGAESINELLWKILPKILKYAQVVHITGQGKNKDVVLPSSVRKRYCQLPFSSSIADLYSISTLAVSRAGANIIAELQTFGIPSLLIPLPLSASHGDQIKNAQILEKNGGCRVLHQEILTPQLLYSEIISLLKDTKTLIQMSKNSLDKKHLNAAGAVLSALKQFDN